MTTADADTTPLAMTAALLHEAGRHYDYIQVGTTRATWDDLSDVQKSAAIDHVEVSRRRSFPEYYEALTTAFTMARKPVPDVTDEHSDLVRFARMRYAIIQCLVGNPEAGRGKDDE